MYRYPVHMYRCLFALPYKSSRRAYKLSPSVLNRWRDVAEQQRGRSKDEPGRPRLGRPLENSFRFKSGSLENSLLRFVQACADTFVRHQVIIADHREHALVFKTGVDGETHPFSKTHRFIMPDQRTLD